MKRFLVGHYRKILVAILVLTVILSYHFSGLFSLKPIIEDPSNGHILEVEYYNGSTLTSLEGYNEEEILRILSQSFCKRTCQKNHGYSLSGNGYTLHITLVENHNICDVVLGRNSFLAEGRDSYIYQIVEAPALFNALLSELRC